MRSVPALASPLRGPWPGVGVRVAIGYLLLYVALDWVSFIHPMRGLDITPWNPQTAVAVALLVWRRQAWWLVWLAATAAEALVRADPLPWPAIGVAAAAQMAGYVLIARALVHRLGVYPQVRTRREFLLFAAIVAGGALLCSLLHVAVLAAFGTPPPDRLLAAVQRGWIGDAVGLLVTLPLLLLVASPEGRRAMLAMARTREWWLLALAACAGTFAVFARATEEQFKFFYLLFLPVVWGGARFGVPGAVGSSALVQLLLIGAVQSATYRPLTVFELQLLMTVLAATGLLLGAIVDEREDTAQKLRTSLRLAAAGDMAAALAHELNQPLAALTSYARASQLLVQQLASHEATRAQPLIDVSGKLVQEAARASAVVKRLRDFFRDRATELQPTPVAQLLQQAADSQVARAQASGVALECVCDAGLPTLWLDPVQIAVVTRNLLANALDAVQGVAQPRVELRANCEEHEVVVSVLDNGPGLSGQALAGLFDPRRSSKPGGMGVGLSISREIVEAHGGRLWADAGPGGRFFFTLPRAAAEALD